MEKNKWIELNGDIEDKLERSYSRMHSEWYTSEKVFVADGNNWPGDWEGRTILALTALGRVMNRQPIELEAMIDNLMLRVNEKKYLGLIREEGIFDEQQISGHSWLLRGLIEYYEWKNDERVLEVISGITENLVKPTLGYYKMYPMKPKDRIVDGGASGNLTGIMIGHWLTSTDIGCAFIMLDGITMVHALSGDEALEPIIDEMLETFFRLDFVELSVQTHATLSALRGAIRYYWHKKDDNLLKKIEEVYSTYLTQGRTENHANYNWFGRPSATEPCAIVDAFIVSLELAKITKDNFYIEEANRVYFNALSYAQRRNGGFGCDVCSGADGDMIKPKIFEAYWCCTMRGAKGLTYVLEESIQIDKDVARYLLYFEGTSEIEFEDGTIKVKNEGQLHRSGRYQITVIENHLLSKKYIELFIPSWANNTVIECNGRKVSEFVGNYGIIEVMPEQELHININMDIQIRKEKLNNINSIRGMHKYVHGFHILANEKRESGVGSIDEATLRHIGNANYCDDQGNLLLKPLFDFAEENDDQSFYEKKILFD